MRPESTPVKIRLPPLSDEAVVEIHDFLGEFLRLFESHYGAQIHRFYADRSRDNIVHRDTRPNSQPDDPPF